MAKNTSTTRKGSPAPAPAPAARKAPPKPLVNPIRPAGTNGKSDGLKLRNISLEPVVFTHDQIAQRAYQLWQKSGNPDELSNWAEAERQLKVEHGIA